MVILTTTAELIDFLKRDPSFCVTEDYPDDRTIGIVCAFEPHGGPYGETLAVLADHGSAKALFDAANAAHSAAMHDPAAMPAWDRLPLKAAFPATCVLADSPFVSRPDAFPDGEGWRGTPDPDDDVPF